MTKTEALELLKASSFLIPFDSNGDSVHEHFVEYTETEETHNWIVYLCTPDKPDDRTYGFVHFVDKKTKEVSVSCEPLPIDVLKQFQAIK